MSPNLNRTLNHFTATELASLLSEAQCQPSDITRDLSEQAYSNRIKNIFKKKLNISVVFKCF